MFQLNRVEKLLEYLYTMEKKLEAEGYDLESLGYSDEVQDAIDELADSGTISV